MFFNDICYPLEKGQFLMHVPCNCKLCEFKRVWSLDGLHWYPSVCAIFPYYVDIPVFGSDSSHICSTCGVKICIFLLDTIISGSNILDIFHMGVYHHMLIHLWIYNSRNGVGYVIVCGYIWETYFVYSCV